ncbi:MAG: hypothetical protein ACQEWL_04810 [Pseudomonadota bacterium]
MNDDVQYEINFVKSVIKYNQNDKNVLSVIPNRILIKLISEIERIHNLQPLAYARNTGMGRSLDVTVYEEKLNCWRKYNELNPDRPDEIFPLYRLDK